jgi:hypothetical protein
MNLVKPGDVVVIKHYSEFSSIKSVVVEVTDNILIARLTKDFSQMNFLEGDPVVVGFEKDNEVFVMGCSIIEVMQSEDIIMLKIDEVEANNERRNHERYPVSLYADIKVHGSNNLYLATIKEISYHGMLVCCKADLEADSRLEVDTYLGSYTISLKASIMRKVEQARFFEYGLKLNFEDSESSDFVKNYILSLSNDQEEIVRKTKSDYFA